MIFRPARTCAALAALICLCVFPAYAQDSAKDEPPKQIQLNSDAVKRFVATVDDVKKWQKSNDTTSKTSASDDDEEEDEEGGSEGGNIIALVQTTKNSPDTIAIFKKHGFSDFEKLNETGQSVMMAYGYADPEGGLADFEPNIRKTIEQVKNDKNFSDAEKAEAIKNLESEFQSVQKLKPLPGNIEAVRPYVAQIKKLMED